LTVKFSTQARFLIVLLFDEQKGHGLECSKTVHTQGPVFDPQHHKRKKEKGMRKKEKSLIKEVAIQHGF
jgi:hypothetical protein